MHILIIEDEPAIADTLLHVLEIDGFTTQWFNTASAGLSYLKSQHCDLLVLDVGLPDANGFELCKTIRAFSNIPIIFLTARNDEIDRVIGLEIGADDYVTKPFSPREMLARIKLRIKKASISNVPEPNKLESIVGDYQFSGKPLGLTAAEFYILQKLLSHSGQVFSREQLMHAANMPLDQVYERNIDSHIKAIRHKLKPFNLHNCIRTKRGFGYYCEGL